MTTAPDLSPTLADARRQSHFALALLLFFLFLSLIPIWCNPYLPMQDYPQHLFQAKLTAAFLNHQSIPAPYQVHLSPTYSAFYLLVWLFNFLLPLAAAGRLAVSAYLLLIALAAWKTLHFQTRDSTPNWPAFLLFPIAFNALYFLGFINFLYAMPVLFLILLYLLKYSDTPWTLPRLLLHFASLILLLFLHPFALVIEGLIITTWLLASLRSTQCRRYFLLAFLATAVVTGCYVFSTLLFPSGSESLTHFSFDSPLKNAGFLLNLFTGLRGISSPDRISLPLWISILAILLHGILKKRALPFSDRTLRYSLIAALILFLAILFTPFSAGTATYLNLRINMTLFFLLTLAATRVRIDKWPLFALRLAIGFLLLRSTQIQGRIGIETVELNPLIADMQPNAAVLPLIFDRESPEADGYYFSLHLNDAFYYQLEKGGITPYLWEAPAQGRTPISFLPNSQPPAPGDYTPDHFRWETLTYPYRYLLIRGGSPSLFHYLDLHATLRHSFAKWRLYELNPPTTQ